MMGRLITPLIRPVNDAQVTSPFGPRTYTDRRTGQEISHLHTGIDYISRNHKDCRVLAIADGIVKYDMDNYNPELAYSDGQHSMGNVVIIEHDIHGWPVWCWYMHLAYNTVEAGERVKQGHILGEYANVGRSNGPHVHIEFRPPGRWRAGISYDPTLSLLQGLHASGIIEPEAA